MRDGRRRNTVSHIRLAWSFLDVISIIISEMIRNRIIFYNCNTARYENIY